MKSRNTTIMEAIVLYCEENSLEPEAVAPAISKLQKIKDELYREAEVLNMVEKVNRIPEE